MVGSQKKWLVDIKVRGFQETQGLSVLKRLSLRAPFFWKLEMQGPLMVLKFINQASICILAKFVVYLLLF
jgi:hypothetical protein